MTAEELLDVFGDLVGTYLDGKLLFQEVTTPDGTIITKDPECKIKQISELTFAITSKMIKENDPDFFRVYFMDMAHRFAGKIRSFGLHHYSYNSFMPAGVDYKASACYKGLWIRLVRQYDIRIDSIPIRFDALIETL